MMQFSPDLADAIGLLAAALVFGAFFLTGPRRILAVSFISSVLWVIHFFMIEAWAGVIVSLASAARNAAGAWFGKTTMILITWISVAFVIIIGLMIDSSGAVVLLAAPARAIANHLRNHEIAFRIACSFSGISYVIYGLSIDSPVAISSALTVCVILGQPIVRRWLMRRRPTRT